MTENIKTLIFAAVAAVALAAALLTGPSLSKPGADDVRGQALFPNFKDPLAVASVEIVECDEASATLSSFQVARLTQRDGKTRWVIPSHDNYPADAKEQVAAAATDLMGLKILGVASESQDDQRLFGVVNPDPKTLKVGETGVGTRITMKDKDGKTLLDLIVGKKVENKAREKTDLRGAQHLRYVRLPNQEAVYLADANTEKLNPKFENWIERNLLDFKPIDMKQVQIRDYAMREVVEGGELALAILQRRQIDLDYDDAADPRWKLATDQKFVADKKNPDSGRWMPVKMAADEELNLARLDDLKYALDDLKIVDVSRKPPGLSADLRVSADFSAKASAVMALRARGFYAGRFVENGPAELLSNDGEVRVQQKNGVEYVLRFGAIADAGAPKKKAKSKDKKKPEEPGADEKTADSDVNRYLFVTVEFNPDLVPKPTLLDLKKEIETKKPAEPKQDAAKTEKKPEAKADKKAAAKSEAKKPEKQPAAAKDEEAQRARVEKENKRRQEEYQQQLADGKKRVAELNARFADWYYIIADNVYKKIHLNRDAIVKKKDKKKEGEKDAKDAHAGHEHGGPAVLAPTVPAEKKTESPKQEKNVPAEKKAAPKQEPSAPAEKKAA
jgi:hypothetical protein